MDQNLLVRNGHVLISALDEAEIPPRAALWVHTLDTDTWRLWIVPPASVQDKREFYRRVAEIVTRRRVELGGLDASDTEMVLDTHPAIRGLRKVLKIPGLGSTVLSGTTFNGFYLPEALILRVDFKG